MCYSKQTMCGHYHFLSSIPQIKTLIYKYTCNFVNLPMKVRQASNFYGMPSEIYSLPYPFKVHGIDDCVIRCTWYYTVHGWLIRHVTVTYASLLL